MKHPKFTQIIQHVSATLALDENGEVWKFNWHQSIWQILEIQQK